MIPAQWETLNRRITRCRKCPRLRDYCAQVSQRKRRAYEDWIYWGRPVPNFGDPNARLLIVGLAPAAHGANRTGRMFTGDRSGDWLYRALHKAGFGSQSRATSRDDGLELSDCAITAVCHCAPPNNKPTPEEIANCRSWISRTIDAMPVRVFLALGRIAWMAVTDEAFERGWRRGRRPQFAHGAQVRLSEGRWLVGSYHPSQQNTFTKRLTEPMFDQVFDGIRRLLAPQTLVVLDTNILVAAAYAAQSASRRIVEECLRGGTLRAAVSPPLKREYDHLLARALRGAAYDRPLRQLIEQAVMVDADPTRHPVPDDPEDAKVLATAAAARAAAIVTNDRHLLELDPHRDIRIVRPQAFLDSCGSQADSHVAEK